MSSVKCHLGQPKKVCQASFREYIHLAKHQAGLPSPSEKTLDPVISKEPSGEQEPFQPQGVRLSASNHWLLKLPWHTSLNHVNIYYVHLWCVEWKKTNLQCHRYMLYHFLLKNGMNQSIQENAFNKPSSFCATAIGYRVFFGTNYDLQTSGLVLKVVNF